jgi:hypothetical protein
MRNTLAYEQKYMNMLGYKHAHAYLIYSRDPL